MGRFWSLLFLSVPILGVAAFVFAVIPGGIFANHWLPEDISQHGAVIDNLFMFIMYLTGVVFIVTSFLLFWFMWKYDADRNTEPVKYVHGSHTLEIIWSIIPAATLLFIAIFQMDAWADARMKYPTDKETGVKKPPLLLVTGRQFEWRMQYAGKDEIIGTPDDIHLCERSPHSGQRRNRYSDPDTRCVAQFLFAKYAHQTGCCARHETAHLV